MGDLPRGEANALPSAVREAAAALGMLVPHAVSLGPGVAESIQDACDGIEAGLTKDEIALAVVGDAASRRALARVVLGDAIRGPKARRERILRVRAGSAFDYTTHTKSGSVVRFARAMPDRDPIYRQSIEQAEEAVADARRKRDALAASVERSREAVRAVETGVTALDAELEAMGQSFAEAWRAHRAAEGRAAAIDRAEPEIPPLFRRTPPWWAVWLWLARWLVAAKVRDTLALHVQNRSEASAAHARAGELEVAAQSAEVARDALKAQRTERADALERAHAALAAIEVELAEERRVRDAETRLDTLLRERAKHAGERRDEFFSDLAELDATPRGDDVDALDVELPRDHPGAPPEGILLVLSPDPATEVDGYALVSDEKDRTTHDAPLRDRLPRAFALVVKPSLGEDAKKAFARVAARKTLVVAARFAMRLCTCIERIALARSAAESEHQRRLGALESQRIPHPDEFRARQITRSASAIEKGADDVLASASARIAKDVDALATEWRDRIIGAVGRSALDVCIADINRRGRLRVLETLDVASEHVANEMQSVGETLERWAFDEIQSSYRTQKRVRPESLVPVTSELTGEDLATAVSPAVPIAGAREAFKSQRRRIGAIGAAIGGTAGAAGLAFAPSHALHAWAWVGAIVGAALGAQSSLFKSSASLRADALEKAATYAKDVEAPVQARLREKRDDIARGIRSSLDEALGDALERLNESITRLMAIERNAIEAERATLAKLVSTRGTLDDHDTRLRAHLAATERAFAQ